MAVRFRSRARQRAVARDSSAPAIERAPALAAQGDVRDAIELLADANRRAPDVDIERLLVKLRFDAAAHAPHARGPSPWPPEVPDLFPGTVAGPPEISPADLTADAVHSAIQHHGSLLVRGLVPRARVDQLVDDIDRTFTAHDGWVDGDESARTSPWFSPLDVISENRPFIRAGDAVMAVESPRAFFHVTELFDEVGIRDVATRFFGEEPLLLANKWALRRVGPDANDPDWHQDGSFMGADIRSLDVWIALSACGRDAPGLDLVGRRLDHVVATGTDDAQLDWTVGRGMVEQVAAGAVVRPEFEPGDALLFDQFCLHRTGIHPGMTRDRYALETWFAAPSSYPPNQLPILY